MNDALQFIVGFLIFCFWAWSIFWVHSDAKRRGKPGFPWALAVFLFWPVTLGVWLAIRPK